MILLSHPTANQNVRQAAVAFADAGLLEEFWTCLNWKEDSFLRKMLPLPARARTELRRRSFPAQLTPFIREYPWREWMRLSMGQLGLNGFGMFSTDAVYFSFDRRVARRLSQRSRIKAIYAYDNGALESFEMAKKMGIKAIYEHPIAYWRRALQYQSEEAALHPEWVSTLPALRDSEEKLARKDKEIGLADLIVTPSNFSKASLSDAPVNAPIEVVPYGAPVPIDLGNVSPTAQKLRVLFVGALSQAKGLSYLLEAVKTLERQIEFTLIGQRLSATIPGPAELSRYRWIPSLPHHELLEEMSRHDVLVFPSLHEGFGLVMTEAMSRGLVVIATAHSAAPDLITDGVDGFIVPIRSATAIQEKLERLLGDRQLVADMKMAARRKAAVFQWETYRQELSRVARALIQ